MSDDRDLARKRFARAAAMDSAYRWAMALEAASSVSLSHRHDCVCTVCRAALGDEEALAEVFNVLGREP